ncbi:MAG: hypothetical protein SOI46_02015 [Eggerthellaceae bacterium]|jgi:glutaredoxin
MATPILYWWGPCETCNIAVHWADENHVELDKRDVAEEGPYQELLALGGDANKIPYLKDGDALIQGPYEIIDYLKKNYLPA